MVSSVSARKTKSEHSIAVQIRHKVWSLARWHQPEMLDLLKLQDYKILGKLAVEYISFRHWWTPRSIKGIIFCSRMMSARIVALKSLTIAS